MSNGNLDNSVPLVGVLKLQITWPKQRGMEPKRTSPRSVITAISRTTTHPRKLVTDKRAVHTAGPLGLTRPSPSSTCCGLNCQHVCTSQDRWHVLWSKTPEERKEHADKAMGPPRSPDGDHALMREPVCLAGSDTPRTSFPRRGLKWWDYSASSWREYKLGASYF